MGKLVNLNLILSIPILLGCGPQPTFIQQYTCKVSGYASCRSECPEIKKDRIQIAKDLSRALLIEAGVTTAEQYDKQVKGFTLLVHSVEVWEDSPGQPVSGKQSTGLIEVNHSLSSLLHEEIHMLHSGDPLNWTHPNWEKHGYYGLDVFFVNTLTNSAWKCEPNRGMRFAMVMGLRAAGRQIDEFLKIHPECLNKEPE